MGSSDWWARRLADPPAPAPGQYTQAPPRSPLSAPSSPPVSAPVTYDANTGAAMADDGIMGHLAASALQTGGSKKVKEDSGTCPECGSGNFFAQRRSESGGPLRTEAAARCFDCGYPIIQSGSSHGSANGVRSSGPAQRARQLPPGHAVTVQDGGRSYTYQPR